MKKTTLGKRVETVNILLYYRSESPTVVTIVTDSDQYPMGQYPFGELPDLPSRSFGAVPTSTNAHQGRPDVLQGAMGPVSPLKMDQSQKDNTLNERRKDVPPPLYEDNENDPSDVDMKPPAYSP